jgi:hypothetical protein
MKLLTLKKMFSQRKTTRNLPVLSQTSKIGAFFNGKAKAIVTMIIVAVLIVSAFVVLSNYTQSKGSDYVPQSYPTATPTPSPVPGSQSNPTVTTKPRDYIGSLGQSAFNEFTPSPGPRPAGLIESAKPINNATWKAIAANAWAYFQPGIGVDSTTGLPGAGYGFPYFTDWDLGVYIQAVIDAQKVGLIGTNGDWGAYTRLEKVLTFLENRELNSTTHYPYWFYQSGNGKDYHQQSDQATVKVDGVDTGRLFIALSNLKTYNPSWSTRIDNFVYNRFGNRSDYASIVPDVNNDCLTSTSVYTFYVASGYAAFWPSQVNPNFVLDNIAKVGNVTTYGVTLPKSSLSCEPILCSVFQLPSNARLNALMKQVYLAHEAYASSTGMYVGFSEGNSDQGFIYEWVVLPSGATWQVTDIKINPSSINPIIYNKVALGFLALYNTTYARNLSVYLEQSFPPPTKGYTDGADYTAEPWSRQLVENVGSNTNGLILEAAKYALNI